MAGLSSNILTIILNTNGLNNQSKDRHWKRLKNMTKLYAVATKFTTHTYTHRYTHI